MADIVNPPGDGDVTVRSMVAEVINATWGLGNSMKDELSTKVGNITGTLDAAGTPTVTAGSVAVPSISEPLVNIPASADVGDIMATFDSKYIEIATWLQGKLVEFRATYFPDEQATYAAAESALRDAMSSGSFLPPDVQAQIFGDDEARIVDAKVRAQDAVVAQFAMRGFPLPPDVAASAVLQIEQKAQDELAESSRKIAMLSVEQFRFVIGKVIELRQSAMGAAAEYLKVLVSGPDVASRLLGVGYDAQSKLISSVSSFYGARTEAVKVMSDVAQYNNSTALEADVKNQAAEMQMISEKLKALLAEANFLAQTTTAMFNNLQAKVGIDASRNASVSYQYSNDTSGTAPAVVDVG